MYHHDIKILNVCVSVSVCNRSGMLGGWDYSNDSQPSYLLYFVLHAHDNKQMHSRSSSWRGHSWRTAVWSDHMRLVLARDTTTQWCWCVRVGGCTRLAQTWWRRWDQKHNYVCNEERTVVHRAVLTWMEVRAPSTSAPRSASCRWMKDSLE